MGTTVWKLAGVETARPLVTTFTLGADDPAVMAQGAREFAHARSLKLKLKTFFKRFDDCFPRKDTRAHLPTYISGQLSDIPEKSVEPIAMAATRPRSLATRVTPSIFSRSMKPLGKSISAISAVEFSRPI